MDFAVGNTQPNLTLLLAVPLAVSEARRAARLQASGPVRDRMEEADRAFFERVEKGFETIARQNTVRIKVVDATQTIERVQKVIWEQVRPLLAR